MVSKELRSSFNNLHDVFLNASLQRKHMAQSPVEDDVERFHWSDRGRFERTWIMFLYVLVECWLSDQMAKSREMISEVVSIEEIECLLREGREDGALDKMRQTRDYMCHRDRREYWDAGRFAPFGSLDYHEKLHMAFSKILLATAKALPKT